jgi:hypothetical protein
MDKGSDKMIYTSYFSFVPKLPSDMLKISVSLFTPRWAKIDGYLPHLNPTEQLLKEAKSGAIPPEEAMKKYRDEILWKLSPMQVYEDLLKILEESEKRTWRCYVTKNPEKSVMGDLLPNGSRMKIFSCARMNANFGRHGGAREKINQVAQF